MKILTPQGDVTAFFARLRTCERAVLMLDYDGTLAPFRIERDQAIPYPGVREILTSIVQTGWTRLVIVSGRAVDELLPLLGLSVTPEIWGAHGWEHLSAQGTYQLGAISAAQSAVFTQLDAWAERQGFTAAWERKPVSRAFHWRAQDVANIPSLRAAVLQDWQVLIGDSGLEIHEFDGGVEMRVPGRDKGLAVRQILAETTPATAVAYLGDDRTDEDAFQAVGHAGLSVLVREQFRPTVADLWLLPPAELLDFLREWDRITKHKRWQA